MGLRDLPGRQGATRNPALCLRELSLPNGLRMAQAENQKTTDPQAWKRTIEIDNALRTTGCRANRDIKQTMYLHRSCEPLELVQLDPTPPVPRAVQLPINFAGECEGVCGV
jgi:hypothetical protein